MAAHDRGCPGQSCDATEFRKSSMNRSRSSKQSGRSSLMDNHAIHKAPLIRNRLAKRTVPARASHANEFILAQSGRTVLCAHHRAQDQARHLPIELWLRYVLTSCRCDAPARDPLSQYDGTQRIEADHVKCVLADGGHVRHGGAPAPASSHALGKPLGGEALRE